MAEMVEGLFRKNDSLDSALVAALRRKGVGPWDRIRFRAALADLTDEERKQMEVGVTKIVVESGAKLPVGAQIVGGVLVSSWLEVLQLLINALPKILEFLAQLLPLFLLV
jgi:hypothetical protein